MIIVVSEKKIGESAGWPHWKISKKRLRAG